MRLYPALTLTWPDPPSPAQLDETLADLDDFAPTAIEELALGLRAFFGSTGTRDAALAHFANRPAIACTAGDVADENWAERSQASLTPITVGRLTVAPPWTVTPELRAQVAGPIVIIQPSMGFGTGHHASTRLCLHWLQQIPLGGSAVLDVGTGSGVLAIAASRLGAAFVLGIDVDADALHSARENLALNQQVSGVELSECDLSVGIAGLGRTFDVILANLTGGLLSRYASVLGGLASAGGRLITSGFQTHEAAEVIGACERAGWILDAQTTEQDWMGAVFVRA